MNAIASSSRTKIINITDKAFNSSPQPSLDYHSLDRQDPVICIDNGSHSWRAGFSPMSAPYIDRTNVVSRYKERKHGLTNTLFGRDCEVDSTTRSNARSMFDGDLLIHGDVLEAAFDYTFIKLGIDTDRIIHPIVMSERLANPLYTRAMTSELLFETYSAPSVTYGIDSLFAFSRQKHKDGLSISLGHNATTIIPVVGGKGILSKAKRIPWGGAQAAELMLKLAQLKYPSFPTKVTFPQATFMARETCYFSSNYEEELTTLGDPSKMKEMTEIFQFPFTQPDVVEKTEAELAAATERRKEQGKRLQEMQAKQRAEKLAIKIAELDEYKTLLLSRPTLKKAEFQTRLSQITPFDTESELEAWVKKTEGDIKRKQKRDLGGDEPDGGMSMEEEPSFPMVDVADEELDEAELKEKRKQRLMKAGWEARVKIREEKKRERERVEEEKRQEEEERATDLAGWSARLKEEQEALIARLAERKKKKASLGDRKSAAAQNRMKNIATLAAEANDGKKRKKTKDEKDDGFGRDDSDWAVYREIGNDEESDAEEDDLAQLQSLETRLLQYDPTFSPDDTLEGRARVKNALINAFIRGGSDVYSPDDLEQSYQLHLNVERIRVPETWFQPGMWGLDSAGVGEIAGSLLNGFDDEERRRLMQCIFVTGGCANIPNLIPRLRNTLTPVLPFRAPLKIVSSFDGGDPRLEAWKGMAEWSGSEEAKKVRVTKAEYEEHGGEWLKEHGWGNGKP